MRSGIQPSWDNMDKWVLWCGKFVQRNDVWSTEPKATFFCHKKEKEKKQTTHQLHSINYTNMKQDLFWTECNCCLSNVKLLNIHWPINLSALFLDAEMFIFPPHFSCQWASFNHLKGHFTQFTKKDIFSRRSICIYPWRKIWIYLLRLSLFPRPLSLPCA